MNGTREASEVMAPVASSSSLSSGSGVEKELEAEDVTTPSGQAASHLSLVEERQLLPGVSVGPNQGGTDTSETFGSLLTEGQPRQAGSPVEAEVSHHSPVLHPVCQ